MKLELHRVILGEKATIGVLRVDGRFECFILEDRVRPAPEEKVPRETAIPEGTYRVLMTYSPRFGIDMPQVMDVPGFSGIRIHPGNHSDDTEGCLLPGQSASADSVGQSRTAYESLYRQLRAAAHRDEEVTITITNH